MGKCEDIADLETKNVFGEAFEEVHLWLDEFQGTPKYRMRHHEAGIQEAIGLFGENAGHVARQHIISDLKEEGWTEADPFPKDEQHYGKMGLF